MAGIKQQTTSTFNGGMIKDMADLATPNNSMIDCLNGTILTFNGNEFVLQNDMGNEKITYCRLKRDFVPLGMKEYGGVIYIVSHNPFTGESEIGSFPSPQRIYDQDEDLLKSELRTEHLYKDITKYILNSNFVVRLTDVTLKPGDSFILSASDEGWSTLSQYISKGEDRKVFIVNLVSITEDGAISKFPYEDINDYIQTTTFSNGNVSNITDVETIWRAFDARLNGVLGIAFELEYPSVSIFEGYEGDSLIIKVELNDHLDFSEDKSNRISEIRLEKTTTNENGESIISSEKFNKIEGKEGETKFIVIPIKKENLKDYTSFTLKFYSKYHYFADLDYTFSGLSLSESPSTESEDNRSYGTWRYKTNTNNLSLFYDFVAPESCTNQVLEFFDLSNDVSIFYNVGKSPKQSSISIKLANSFDTPYSNLEDDKIYPVVVDPSAKGEFSKYHDTTIEKDINGEHKLFGLKPFARENKITKVVKNWNDRSWNLDNTFLLPGNIYIVFIHGFALNKSLDGESKGITHYVLPKILWTTGLFNDEYTIGAVRDFNSLGTYIGDDIPTPYNFVSRFNITGQQSFDSKTDYIPKDIATCEYVSDEKDVSESKYHENEYISDEEAIKQHYPLNTYSLDSNVVYNEHNTFRSTIGKVFNGSLEITANPTTRFSNFEPRWIFEDTTSSDLKFSEKNKLLSKEYKEYESVGDLRKNEDTVKMTFGAINQDVNNQNISSGAQVIIKTHRYAYFEQTSRVDTSIKVPEYIIKENAGISNSWVGCMPIGLCTDRINLFSFEKTWSKAVENDSAVYMCDIDGYVAGEKDGDMELKDYNEGTGKNLRWDDSAFKGTDFSIGPMQYILSAFQGATSVFLTRYYAYDRNKGISSIDSNYAFTEMASNIGTIVRKDKKGNNYPSNTVSSDIVGSHLFISFSSNNTIYTLATPTIELSELGITKFKNGVYKFADKLDSAISKILYNTREMLNPIKFSATNDRFDGIFNSTFTFDGKDINTLKISSNHLSKCHIRTKNTYIELSKDGILDLETLINKTYKDALFVKNLNNILNSDRFKYNIQDVSPVQSTAMSFTVTGYADMGIGYTLTPIIDAYNTSDYDTSKYYLYGDNRFVLVLKNSDGSDYICEHLTVKVDNDDKVIGLAVNSLGDVQTAPTYAHSNQNEEENPTLCHLVSGGNVGIIKELNMLFKNIWNQ